MSYLRKMRRHMARLNMEKKRLSNVCKDKYGSGSYFSKHWKEYIK